MKTYTKEEAEPLMKAEEIAKILQVAPRQVSEKYAHTPGFPKAKRLPSPNGQGAYRWDRNDVIRWINAL